MSGVQVFHFATALRNVHKTRDRISQRACRFFVMHTRSIQFQWDFQKVDLAERNKNRVCGINWLSWISYRTFLASWLQIAQHEKCTSRLFRCLAMKISSIKLHAVRKSSAKPLAALQLSSNPMFCSGKHPQRPKYWTNLIGSEHRETEAKNQ